MDWGGIKNDEQQSAAAGGNKPPALRQPVFASEPSSNANAKLDDILAEIVFGDDGVGGDEYNGSSNRPGSDINKPVSTAARDKDGSPKVTGQKRPAPGDGTETAKDTPKGSINQASAEPPAAAAAAAAGGGAAAAVAAAVGAAAAATGSSFEALQARLAGVEGGEELSVLMRKERNKEHAKRSRTRKKFLLDSFQYALDVLTKENEALRKNITASLGEEEAEREFAAFAELHRANAAGAAVDEDDDAAVQQPALFGPDSQAASAEGGGGGTGLEAEDAGLLRSLQKARFSFVISNPALPDNPIVFASPGFLELTGYRLREILGRNCRFLQGPATDPQAVRRIREAVQKGEDASVRLLNYTADGRPFWNQFFIAPLKDNTGRIVNFVGVQTQISEEVAKTMKDEEEKEALLGVGGGV